MTLHKLLRSPILITVLPFPSWWAPLPGQPGALLAVLLAALLRSCEHPQPAAWGCQHRNVTACALGASSPAL